MGSYSLEEDWECYTVFIAEVVLVPFMVIWVRTGKWSTGPWLSHSSVKEAITNFKSNQNRKPIIDFHFWRLFSLE